METFPTAWQAGLRESIEIEMFRRSVDAIDGFIIPTLEMLDFTSDIAPEITEKPVLLKPWFYPSCYFTPHRGTFLKLKPADSSPEIVFMGSLDLTRGLNDVRSQLISLARAGIKVHCTQVEGLEHPNISTFETFNNIDLATGTVANFMQQYDACLVTYATGGKRRPAARFRTSLPCRLTIAMGAGLPIILPKGRFQAIERLVLQEGIGFAYESSREVFTMLQSPEWRSVRMNAQRKRNRYMFSATDFRNWVMRLLSDP